MVIERCTLCPRMCGARREADRGEGFCAMGADPVVARAALHAWEEPCISGARGSGTVFFSGCPLGCVFCQNHDISHGRSGQRLSPEDLAATFDALAGQGAHNLNLVTAVHFTPAVLKALSLRRSRLPVVFNSGGYERVETLRDLDGAADVYLPDLKYFGSALSARYAGAPDYFSVATAAIFEMVRQAGPPQRDADGMLTRGVMIRHLVLPGASADSLRVVDWVADHLAGQVLLSLMSQYVPCGRAVEFPEINRRVTTLEYRRVVDHAYDRGLTEGYIQQRGAADEAFIPPFDGSGLVRIGD